MFLAGLVVLSNLTLKPAPLGGPAAVRMTDAQAPMLTQAFVLQPVKANIALPAEYEIGLAAARPMGVALQNIRIQGVGDMKISAVFNNVWDGQEERAGEEQFAEVRKQERKAEEYRHMHAEIPPLDYRGRVFSEEGAREFGESRYDLGGKTLTGKEILTLLVTPFAAVDGLAPDPRAVDFAGFGVSETGLRALAEAEGLSYHRLEAVLREAHRDGLVYRLRDNGTGKTYTGVTYETRAALGLKEKPKAEVVLTKPDAPAETSAFADALIALSAKAEKLPPKDELFEFTANVVASAVGAGKLKSGRLSSSFTARMNAVDLEGGSVANAVLSLVESADGTDWADDALALADAAVAEGLLAKAELEQVLRDLR